MKMKKITSRFLMLTALVVGLSMLESCYPDDSLSPTETDVVFTNYYDSVHDMFKNYTLYYMPDTVYNIDTTKNAEPIKYQDRILSDIESNMTSYGYTRVTDDDNNLNPELVIVASGIVTTNVSVYYWYPYPGYGWGWGGYGGYGWGYPGYYPPVPYYSSYTTGTLRMEIFNPSDYRVIKGDTINPVYWTAGINGVLASNTEERITTTINQAFKQSPYLNSTSN